LAALCVVASIAAACAGGATAATTPALPSRSQLAADRARFLTLAETGVGAARTWFWNAKLGWYNERLDPRWHRQMPLARLWSAYGLFEAVDALAIAAPGSATRAAVATFAKGAERYWNPDRQAYGYYPGMRGWTQIYYDDDGWWAIGFLDAYRATGDRRYLAAADRAFRFVVSGWDDQETGGIWWDTSESNHKTSEPVAAAAYVGAALYGETGDQFYLDWVRKLIAWADGNDWVTVYGLYGRNHFDDTVMSYVQGMMIGAHLELCHVLDEQDECQRAQQLAVASVAHLGTKTVWAPGPDAIYLRFMLELYRANHDPRWYAIAYWNAKQAIANAVDIHGLYLRHWDGREGVRSLREHGALVSLLAWLAATPPPGS
jgi:uncharacterized protein YyaL (SSP411 family)